MSKQPRRGAGAGRPVFVAVIGDIVRSRSLTRESRLALQNQMQRTLRVLNRRYSHAIAARFLITVGDEFQGMLSEPSVLPELIRLLESDLGDVEVRLGIGRGTIDTELRPSALGMDGPAWHAAREAISRAGRHRRLGGVFVGFGTRDDLTLNAIARALHQLRKRSTIRQRSLLTELLEGSNQSKVADRIGISKQAVHKQARSAGWEAYREAEDTWTWVLKNPSHEVDGA